MGTKTLAKAPPSHRLSTRRVVVRPHQPRGRESSNRSPQQVSRGETLPDHPGAPAVLTPRDHGSSSTMVSMCFWRVLPTEQKDTEASWMPPTSLRPPHPKTPAHTTNPRKEGKMERQGRSKEKPKVRATLMVAMVLPVHPLRDRLSPAPLSRGPTGPAPPSTA